MIKRIYTLVIFTLCLGVVCHGGERLGIGVFKKKPKRPAEETPNNNTSSIKKAKSRDIAGPRKEEIVSRNKPEAYMAMQGPAEAADGEQIPAAVFSQPLPEGMEDAPCLEHGTHAPEECPGSEPPTPEGVDAYRVRLEERLLERYNNLPEFAGKIAMVTVLFARPIETSLNGMLIRAEFDQLVYDIWGNRIPALEKEYFVVTFGAGGAEMVRSDPSIRVGLDLEKTYSERAPLAVDPFRNIESVEAFRSAPQVKMPQWWRPEFPETDF